MDEEYRNQIKKIIADTQCPHECKCAGLCFDHLIIANDQTVKIVLKCTEKEPSGCPHAATLGDEFYCKCPLRTDIAKKLSN